MEGQEHAHEQQQLVEQLQERVSSTEEANVALRVSVDTVKTRKDSYKQRLQGDDQSENLQEN